jgi:hypothetical protein
MMNDSTATTGAGADYPIRLDIPYPESLSRWLIFVKWLLAIPHIIIVYVLGYIFQLLTFIAIFTVLFTKRFPRGMFTFNVGMRRWQLNTYAYVFLLRDEYPPFSLDTGQYPVAFEADYPAELSRFSPLYQWLLAIPHFIVLIFLTIAAALVTIVAFFAILFTGKYPRGLFDFVVGVERWSERVTLYAAFMTNEYPPFSLR